jgi:hypothetical protein
VLCIDGLDEGYAKSFSDVTPTIRGMTARGAFGPCRAQIPSTAPAWTEFGIGVPPKSVGVFGERVRATAGRVWAARDFPHLWNGFRALSWAGVSVGIYHLPVWAHWAEDLGRELEPGGGWVCSGDYLHDYGHFPVDLPVDAAPPKPTRQHLLRSKSRSLPGDLAGQQEKILRAVFDSCRAYADELKRVYEARPVDVLFAYLFAVDTAHHTLVHNVDLLKACYAHADAFCARARALAEWDDVLLVSDHGGRPVHLTDDSLEFDGRAYRFASRGNGSWWQVMPGTHTEDGMWALERRENPPRPMRARSMLRGWLPQVVRWHGGEVPGHIGGPKVAMVDDVIGHNREGEAWLAEHPGAQSTLLDVEAADPDAGGEEVEARLRDMGYVD